MYAGWGEVYKSLVLLLLAGEERFERSSRVVLEKSVALLGVLCVAFGVAFGVDAWSGRGGLLIHVLLEGLLLLLSTEQEFERSIGVVLKIINRVRLGFNVSHRRLHYIRTV